MKVAVGWSGGKESALALYTVMAWSSYTVSTLLTTFTEGYDRVTMHGVRRGLVERQAEALGIPLHRVFIPRDCSMNVYDERMGEAVLKLRGEGIEAVVFGDVFLEDVRRYREENLSKLGMGVIEPLWGRSTRELAETFIDLGFKAIVTCIDTRLLSKEFLGRIFDEGFLEDLPSNVDPCGENGEFHTFVFQGPIFKGRVEFNIGESLKRGFFLYCDLIPLPQKTLDTDP